MKKLSILSILLLFSVMAFAQPFSTINNGDAGSTVRATLNSALDYLDGLGVDIEYSVDTTSWHYPWASGDRYVRYSSDYGTSWTDPIYLFYDQSFDTLTTSLIILGGDTVSSFVETQGWDSLTFSSNYLYWWYNGSKLDSTQLTIPSTMIYKISLPTSTTVAGRCSAAVEGTDYPTGWTVEAGTSAVDLKVTHGLGRRVASVTIFSVTGTQERQLFNNAAYSGIYTDTANELVIESLATVQKEISIYITFE
jgi:hypothetical protein